MNGEDKQFWNKNISNEWVRLVKDNRYGIKGAKTIRFIRKYEVPKERDVTNATFVCDFKPPKQETYRVRITVTGDRLLFPDDAGSPIANMVETKILIKNSILGAKYGARFLSAGICIYFLNLAMGRAEYMEASLKILP